MPRNIIAKNLGKIKIDEIFTHVNNNPLKGPDGLNIRGNIYIDDNIRIKWLDEQFEERQAAHIKRSNAGRKGGLATQNKHSLSNAQALRKEKKRKDKYANDNLLKVDAETQKLLDQ